VLVVFGGVRRAETFSPEGLENIPHLSSDMLPHSAFYLNARNPLLPIRAMPAPYRQSSLAANPEMNDASSKVPSCLFWPRGIQDLSVPQRSAPIGCR
jgi:hypothetical protein